MTAAVYIIAIIAAFGGGIVGHHYYIDGDMIGAGMAIVMSAIVATLAWFWIEDRLDPWGNFDGIKGDD